MIATALSWAGLLALALANYLLLARLELHL